MRVICRCAGRNQRSELFEEGATSQGVQWLPEYRKDKEMDFSQRSKGTSPANTLTLV